jgi:signal transduction histidine kinase
MPFDEPIVAPAGKRNVEFTFTAPYFNGPGKLGFKYLLEGFDHEWVNAGSRHVAYYTNLPPAEYRFRVLACLGEKCSEARSQLPITFLPAFYETRTFAFLALGLLGSMGLLFHRLRVRHLTAREQRLRALVEYRTRELRESRDQLEVRVGERTRELSYMNQQLESEITVRREAEQRAGAASRAKSQFLANMSHEIRTPINGIMGMAEVLSGIISDPEQAEYLDILRTSADDLLQIVTGILDFSTLESGNLSVDHAPFQLSACIGQIYRSVLTRAEAKHLSFTVSVADDVPDRVVGDPRRLSQVLVNLLDNAVKFTASGSIWCGVEVAESSAAATCLRFVVRDTGIGIEHEKQELMFQAFAQADSSNTREFGGVGLGLSICERLVALMHGEITFKSEPGTGSEFTFTASFGIDPTFSPETLAAHSLPTTRSLIS